MALAIGTNVGFCAARPSGDPGGATAIISNYSLAIKCTSPTGSYAVSEVGFYNMQANNGASHYDVGLYSHDAGNNRPDVLLGVSRNNVIGASSVGWFYGAFSYTLTSATTYWIASQADSVSPVVNCESATDASMKFDYIGPGSTALPDPWGASSSSLTRLEAIYALYAAAGGSSTPSSTPSNTPSNTPSATPSPAGGHTRFRFDRANDWVVFEVEGTESMRLKNNGDLDLHGVVHINAF